MTKPKPRGNQMPPSRYSVNRIRIAIFVISLISAGVAHAGWFDPGIQTAGDILSGGRTAHQRDWEACERDKNARVNGLSGQVATLDKQIATQSANIDGYQSQIKQAADEQTFIVSQNIATEMMLLVIQEIEAHQGSLTQVVATLQGMMDSNTQSSQGLESWRTTLEALLPSIAQENQFAARVLLGQIKLALASRSSSVIENLIRVLEVPVSKNILRLNAAWGDLIANRQKRLNTVKALQIELEEKVRKSTEQKAKTERDRTSTAKDLKQTQDKSC
jgi:hypothetical protein